MDWFDHRYPHDPQRAAAERQKWDDREAAAKEAARCEGGVCIDINRQCSKHSYEYQIRHGRAAND